VSSPENLQTRLKYTFRNIELLRLALTHPSVAHEAGQRVQHNQRLEFLGDAVLGLSLTQELYEKFPAYGEGPLTKARAEMVNRRSLAEQSHTLGLGQYLVLSKGEESSGGRERASTLADAFEALIGAIFLDGGFQAAKDFVLREFHERFTEMASIPIIENPKGELQEMLQANSNDPPEYFLGSVTGPDHDRCFECTVHHGGKELGRGQGKSKKAAQTEAALVALRKLRNLNEKTPASPIATTSAPAPIPPNSTPHEASVIVAVPEGR
jgi:ribonuclease-3